MNKKRPNKRVIKFRSMNEKKPNKRKTIPDLLSGENFPNKRYILEKDLRLKAKAKVLNDSICWWEDRMNDSFERLDVWEERVEKKENSYSLSFDPFEAEEGEAEELQEIIREIEFLAKRGEIETKASKELEAEIDEFLKECRGMI
jgi:hypothetical protein